jgi:hypothetical protein
MRKTVIAALATCAGAPILALGIAAPAAWAQPTTTSPCSTGCGGAGTGQGGTSSGGAAQGGYVNESVPGVFSVTEAGTIPVVGGQTTGHATQTVTGVPQASGSVSGNFTNGIPGTGHCTGGFQTAGYCSTGP